MRNSCKSYDPTIDLRLLSGLRMQALITIAHLPAMIGAWMLPGWWMPAFAMVVLFSIVLQVRRAAGGYSALVWYPSGSTSLIGADGASVPARLLSGRTLGRHCCILELARARSIVRVLVLRFGQQTPYRHLRRRLFGIQPIGSEPLASRPNGRRSALRSVV